MNSIMPTDYAQVLSDYFYKYLKKQKGLSDNTIASYGDAITLLHRYCEEVHHKARERLKIEDLTRESIEGFYEWLEDSHKYTSSSRNQRRAAINAFFRYLMYRDPKYVLLCQNILAIPKKRFVRQPFQHLSVEAVDFLFEQCDVRTRNGQRDFAMLVLMYESAARISEIIDLKVGDILLDKKSGCVHLHGKGEKRRTVPIVSDIADVVKKYINSESEYRECSASDPLFVSRNSEKFTRSGATYIFQKYVAMAREKKVTLYPEKVSPHILRHSRAMHWLEIGIEIEYIQKLLGHAHSSTTGIYARISREMARKRLDTVRPSQAIGKVKESWTEDQSLMTWLAGFQDS